MFPYTSMIVLVFYSKLFRETLSQGDRSCQPPYTCQRFALNGQYYCCTGNVDLALICPSGSSTWMEFDTQRPQVCRPNSRFQSCPRGYICTYSSSLGQNYCCSSVQAGFCPSGTNPYIEPNTLNPPTCQRGVFGTCPAAYTCQFSPIGGDNYCCPFIEGPMCPNGITDRGYCTPYRPNECPPGYDCIHSFRKNKFVCCATPVAPFRFKRHILTKKLKYN